MFLQDELKFKPWESVASVIGSKPHFVVYCVDTAASSTSGTHDIVSAFASLVDSMPAYARHLFVLQIVPLDALLSESVKCALVPKSIAFSVYLKCRTAAFPRKSILAPPKMQLVCYGVRAFVCADHIVGNWPSGRVGLWFFTAEG